MSELMNTQNSERCFRWQLLTSVSALALFASVNTHAAKAADEDADRPAVWIELGSQMEHVTGQGDPFTPGFLAANPASPVLQPVSPVQVQNPLPFSFAADGKISFQPEGSNWVFSAAVNYGRSSNFKHVDRQTNGVHHAYVNGDPVKDITVLQNRANLDVIMKDVKFVECQLTPGKVAARAA